MNFNFDNYQEIQIYIIYIFSLSGNIGSYCILGVAVPAEQEK